MEKITYNSNIIDNRFATLKEMYDGLDKEQIVCGDVVIFTTTEDPASKVYVKQKTKWCNKMGLSVVHIYEPNESNLISQIETFNNDNTVSGMIVQLPLAKDMNESKVLSSISEDKDLDGFYSHKFQACTPRGIISMIKDYCLYDYNNLKQPLGGLNVVIVNRSRIVGKPLAQMMIDLGATVTVCNHYTKNLSHLTKHADILVTAIGKTDVITPDMLNPKGAIIDCGMNRKEDGKLCGDIKDYPTANNICKFISPVPGGVGRYTVYSFLRNIYHSITKDKEYYDFKNF